LNFIAFVYQELVLDRLGNSFGRYVYWLYDFEGGYVNTKIYKIFKTAAGRPADGKVIMQTG